LNKFDFIFWFLNILFIFLWAIFFLVTSGIKKTFIPFFRNDVFPLKRGGQIAEHINNLCTFEKLQKSAEKQETNLFEIYLFIFI